MSAPDATTAPEGTKAEKKEVEPRPYVVTSKTTLDLNQDPATLIAALEALAPDSSQVEIYVVVGKPQGLTPIKAIKELGQTTDLHGDFDVIADNSITEFKDVKIGTERVVKIG
jgi:hypothetical protein